MGLRVGLSVIVDSPLGRREFYDVGKALAAAARFVVVHCTLDQVHWGNVWPSDKRRRKRMILFMSNRPMLLRTVIITSRHGMKQTLTIQYSLIWPMGCIIL